MAWTRTTLCFAANALLLLRVAMQKHNVWLAFIGFLLLAVAGLFLVVARERRRSFDGSATPAAVNGHAMALCSTASLMAAFAGLWVCSLSTF